MLHHLLITLHALSHCPPLAAHPAFVGLPSALLSLYPCYEAGQARDFLSLSLQLLLCVEESGAWPAGVAKRSHLQSASGDKLVLLLLYFSTYTLHQRLRYLLAPNNYAVLPDFPYSTPHTADVTAGDAITAMKAQQVVAGSRTVRMVAEQAAEMAEWKEAAATLYDTSKQVNGRLKQARDEEERLLQTVDPLILSAEGEQQRATLAASTKAAYAQLQRLVQQTSMRGAALADITNRRWQPTTLSRDELCKAAGVEQPLPLKDGRVDAVAVARRWKDELTLVRRAVQEAVKQRAIVAAAASEVDSCASEQRKVSADVQRLQQEVQQALSKQLLATSTLSLAAANAEQVAWLPALHRPLTRMDESATTLVAPSTKLTDMQLENTYETAAQCAGAASSVGREDLDRLLSPPPLTPVKPAPALAALLSPSSLGSPCAYAGSAGLLDESIELIDQC